MKKFKKKGKCKKDNDLNNSNKDNKEQFMLKFK